MVYLSVWMDSFLTVDTALACFNVINLIFLGPGVKLLIPQ